MSANFFEDTFFKKTGGGRRSEPEQISSPEIMRAPSTGVHHGRWTFKRCVEKEIS